MSIENCFLSVKACMQLKHLDDYRNGKIKYEELAPLNGISILKLRAVFRENDLLTNKAILDKSINHDFFEKIDCEEKAYLLGIFASDGYVSKKGRICLSLSEKDSSLVEWAKNILCPKHSISISKQDKPSKEGYFSRPMFSFSFSSKKMRDDLRCLGVVTSKTYVGMNLPDIPKDLISHYLRGYFDGDGSFSVKEGMRANGFKYKNANFSIISKTKNILEDFSQVLTDLYIKNSIFCSKKCFVLSVSGFKNNLKLKNFLYNNATVFLERKRKKFDLIPEQKKYMGVFFVKKLQKFRASLEFQKKFHYLGLFDNIDDAVKCADLGILKIRGADSNINIEENRLLYLKELGL
jgi:hypothetical protein